MRCPVIELLFRYEREAEIPLSIPLNSNILGSLLGENKYLVLI